MPRFLFTVLALTAFCLAGCQSKNPLDWKIEARSPEAFEVWLDRHQHLLPPDLQLQFGNAYAFLRNDTAVRIGATQPEKIANQLCPRLHAKTIRAVILEAGQIEADATRLRISTLVDNIARNVKLSASLPDAATEKRFADQRTAQAASIQTLRARIAEIDAQARQLSGGVR